MLSEMKPAQKTQLELVFKDLRHFKENEILWTYGEDPLYAVLIQKGNFFLYGEGEKFKEACGSGYYIGDVAAMLKEQKTRTKVVSVEDGSAYVMHKSDFLTFLNKNPGLLVYFSDVEYCN